MNIIYLASSFIAIFILFYSYQKLTNPEVFAEKKSNIIKNKKIILTIPTYLDFPDEDKWECLYTAIDSILYHEPHIKAFIDFYVINEYCENPREDWKTKVTQKYPFVTFIQKTSDLKGYENTLNIILDLIKTHVYWIHLEESWYSIRPFIMDAMHIMDNSKITQLQFSKVLDGTKYGRTDWIEKVIETNCHRIPRYNNYCMISNTETDTKPLYSLRPSINRVKDYNFGKFNVSDKFETEFGERWMKKNYVKAIIMEGSAARKMTHVSCFNNR